ncbi:MAG: hypothetical protein ACPGC5_02155 [Flavobacteriaceae bacterium]
MQATIIEIIAFKFLKDSFQSRGVYLLLGIFALLSFYAAWSGWESFEHHNETGTAHQEWARESWEANPDKHPHRMAHFGTFAFRLKTP